MKQWYVYILMFVVVSLEAQHDSIQVPEVHLSNTRLKNYKAGTKYQSLDSLSLYLNGFDNLGSLLENLSPLFIKSYGMSSLATSSFRGGSASQTSLLWNGINLNSSMNGVTDFSLIPSTFFNEIGVQYGGASSLWGSGAFGGAVHLNNNAVFDKGLKVEIGGELGSFSNNSQLAKVEFSKKNNAFSLSFFRNNAINNFPFYKNNFGRDSLVQQNNSAYNTTGMLGQYKIRVKKNQIVEVRHWYQNTTRFVPPTLTQNASVAFQKDESARSSAMWKFFKGKDKFQIKGAHLFQVIDFTDSLSNINAHNVSHTLIGEVQYQRLFSKSVLFNVGLLNTNSSAVADNYLSKVSENRVALFSSLKYQSKTKKLNSVLSGRGELVDQTLMVPTLSLQGNYLLKKWVEFKGKASTLYRVPTLNDKYWSPGGNIDLLPERGHSQELGVVLNGKVKKLFLMRTEWTVFNKKINDWIAWSPAGAFWTPQNIKKVWSRGIETQSKLNVKIQDVDFILNLMTNYVLSTNEEVENENDKSKGKQLIYVPRYSGMARLIVMYKDAAFVYRHNYTGYRFVSSDNSNYLTPFDVGAVHFSYRYQRKKYLIKSFLGIENIWGEQYQRVANRPMPLINYSLGVNLILNKPSKTTNK